MTEAAGAPGRFVASESELCVVDRLRCHPLTSA
jgi:hypothetical protein